MRRGGCPSLINDDLVQKVNESVRDDRRFTISDVPALPSDFKEYMTLSAVIWVASGRIL